MDSIKFFAPITPPEKWTLYDVLIWVAAKKLPTAYFDHDGIEFRNSVSLFNEHIPNLGHNLTDDFFEESETQLMGLNKDPYLVNLEREINGEDYLLSPDFYKQIVVLDGDPDFIRPFKQRQELLYQKALKHHEYEQKWLERFEEVLDIHKSNIHLALKTGTITAEAIPCSSFDYERLEDELHEAMESQSNFEASFSKVPKERWLMQGIDWEGSKLKFRVHHHIAIRFDYENVIAAFPPAEDQTKAVFSFGNNIFMKGTTHAKFKARRGRPTKNWDEMNVKIAEVILNHNGDLPKQEALALELSEWYEHEFGEKIGVSTIQAKLKSYYGKFKSQKSGK